MIILFTDRWVPYIHQTNNPSKNWFFKSVFTFKVRQHSQQVNNSSIFNTKHAELLENGKCSVIFLHPTCSYNHFNNPHRWYPPLLQLIFTSLFYLTTILIDIHFLYTSALFLLPTFTNLFPSLDHSANSDSTKIPMNKWFLCGLALFLSLHASLKYGQG